MPREVSIKPYVSSLQADFNTDAKLFAEEAFLLNKVNEERAKAGLPLLLINLKLVRLARIKSEEMFEINYFNHISPAYGTPLDMLRRSGINARVMGAENIAKAKNILRVHSLLMSSREHRDNILNPIHDTIGIGVHKSIYGILVTQLFIGH